MIAGATFLTVICHSAVRLTGISTNSRDAPRPAYNNKEPFFVHVTNMIIVIVIVNQCLGLERTYIDDR